MLALFGRGRILDLYEALLPVEPSAGHELIRAAAMAMQNVPFAGMESIDAKGSFLKRSGRRDTIRAFSGESQRLAKFGEAVALDGRLNKPVQRRFCCVGSAGVRFHSGHPATVYASISEGWQATVLPHLPHLRIR